MAETPCWFDPSRRQIRPGDATGRHLRFKIAVLRVRVPPWQQRGCKGGRRGETRRRAVADAGSIPAISTLKIKGLWTNGQVVGLSTRKRGVSTRQPCFGNVVKWHHAALSRRYCGFESRRSRHSSVAEGISGWLLTTRRWFDSNRASFDNQGRVVQTDRARDS